MVIVGLGNPGQKYEATRHNAGFRIVDSLVSRENAKWKKERQVEWAKVGSHWIIKPMAFMNESGPALKDFLDYKKVTCVPADIIVVHDELDFEPGDVRLQTGKSSAGHNGVESIIEALGTQDFHRLRFGIGSNRSLEHPLPSEDYVLQHFSAAEKSIIDSAVEQAVALLEEKIQ